MNEVRIIVVGAGPSGIASATRLIQNGFENVLILEAEERIGGRIHTADFGDGIVDLGAQWVHGEKDNVVFSLANPHNLLGESVTSLFDDSTVYVEPNGSSFVLSEKLQIFSIIQDIEEDSKEFFKTNAGSLGEYFVQEFKKRLKDQGVPTEEWPQANRVLEFYEKLENSIDASDSWFETSGQGRAEYWECEGNLLWRWKSGGYRTVLDLLMRKYPDKSKEIPVLSKTHFKKEVEQITWDGVQDSNNGKVSITCSDGSTYTADHVIVTVSLGVLKEKAETMFYPQLPHEKLQSIMGLSIGTVDKMFLKFPHRWWPTDVQGFNLLWTEEEKAELSHCMKGRDKLWTQSVFGFYSVDNQPQVLVAWVVGPHARHMEQLSDHEVIDDLMELLEKFIGKSYNIPQPDGLLRSTWSANPHFRGSYSFRSVESDKLDASAAHLAEPLSNCLGKQVLLFAGEATHDHFYSTVHGAIESGWREAERLTELYRHVIYKVAIVGAGISGLAAAKTLLEDGIDNIVVLEAQASAGGRIFSVPLDDGWLEAGAQWLHGENNDVWRIASQNGLLSDLISSEGEGLYIREDGVVFEPSLVYQVHNVVNEILEDCEHFVEETPSESNIPTSIGHYLKQKFDEYLESCLEDSEEIKDMKMELYDWHVRFQVIDNSCMVLDKLSAKAWGKYVFCGGTDYVNFKNGYSSLIHCITESMPPSILKYKCPVKKIMWKRTIDTSKNTNEAIKETNLNGEGVCSNSCRSKSNSSDCKTECAVEIRGNKSVSTQREGKEIPVVIECEDGSQVLAEHAIITCSLGYLKENYRTMFSPSLPHDVEKTIEDLGFATINKVFLVYQEPWWNKDTKGFQLIWSKKGNMEPTVSKPSSWTRDLTGFDVLPSHKAVLLGWVGSKGAEIMEQLSEEEVGQHCTELLKRFTLQSNIPNPKTVVRTRWLANPYIRGGYSHTSTSCDESHVGPSTLATPICAEKIDKMNGMSKHYHPSLLFAGEATHETFFSTTHGAYETGLKQAKVISTYYRNNLNLHEK